MAEGKIKLELFGTIRFVRQGEEIFFGPNHRTILQELKFGQDDKEIKSRLNIEGKNLDMGLLYRTFSLIQVGENSQTYDLPNITDLPELRAKTMSILRTTYPQEIFLEVDKIK